MLKKITIMGMYGDERGSKPREGHVTAYYDSRGADGTLSLSFAGAYQVDIPFRPVEALIGEVRVSARGLGNPAAALERYMRLDGFCSVGTRRNLRGPVSVWFRRAGDFEMLTCAFYEWGQISVPYASIEPMIRRERRNLI